MEAEVGDVLVWLGLLVLVIAPERAFPEKLLLLPTEPQKKTMCRRPETAPALHHHHHHHQSIHLRTRLEK